MVTPSAPGTLSAAPLVGNELVDVITGGPQRATATVAEIAAGGSQQSGTFVANGATGVVVNNANVTANSVILFTLKTLGGTQGAQPTVTGKTAGVSFTVACTALDTSTYNYIILG